MGASKTHQFSQEEINLSLVARALSHPARIAIIHHLKTRHSRRNIDLIPLLGLSKTTVHQYLMKLKDAEMIDFQFMASSYSITLNTFSVDDFSVFVNHISD